MPSEKLEPGILKLKNFRKMDAELPQVNSQAELVQQTVEDGESAKKTLKDVKFREWVHIIILCFVNLINYMDRFTLAGILKDVQTNFDIKDDKGGLLQTVFIISYMIFAPLFGYLGDRYSRRWIMAAGVFVWSLTTLAGSFMESYWWFLMFRACVGVGEASYSTIAPTIISDMFVHDIRSKMLALFYFAIPVGSGLGYIVGSKTAALVGSWHWALRVTPILGAIAVLLIVFVLEDPERGASESSTLMETTPWSEDIKDIVQNRSFMFTTAGFTCVAFVAGALAWWGPTFIEMGINLQGAEKANSDTVAYRFGIIAMIAGIIGVPLGSYLAQSFRPKFEEIDAFICAIGSIVSGVFVYWSLFSARYSANLCFALVFFCQLFLNLTWSLVADMSLYVVLPTRRSTAEGFQLLVAHALGDAGSPYLIGVLSEAFKGSMNSTATATASSTNVTEFRALQYALFSTCIVEVIGGFFFLIVSFYVIKDKLKVDRAVQEARERSPMEVEHSIDSFD